MLGTATIHIKPLIDASKNITQKKTKNLLTNISKPKKKKKKFASTFLNALFKFSSFNKQIGNARVL